MHEDAIACASIVERGDPDRFRATMASSAKARERLFPIYAFNVEVSRVTWMTREAMIAEMRLQWWREALCKIRNGDSVGRHEIATSLADVLDRRGAELLDELVEARKWDIHREPFAGMDAMQDYLRSTSGNLMVAAARALGDCVEESASDAGFGMGIAGWLCAVPALIGSGRHPLVDASPDSIRSLANTGLSALEKARKTGAGKTAFPAMLAAWKSAPVLRMAVKSPERALDGRLGLSPVAGRLSLIAKAALGRW
ncbi:MAG: squalene/phytoene synthase family protein [Roseovarius sp.]|nr:squalene/phytoene synthase family protein [Roseovarius sp.]